MSSDIVTLRDQWVRPSDILGVLMIIGADVVQRALAQLSGGSLTPVSFSFGWVAYSFDTLVLAVGDNRLMPACDCPSIVINAHHGHVRANNSWVLGRLIRDFDHWKPVVVEDKLQLLLDEATKADADAIQKAANYAPIIPPPLRRQRAGLCISVFRTSPHSAGNPTQDWVFYSGIVIAILQLVIAAIPVILHRNWWILMITSSGILLSFAHGVLPQWESEKWHCRRQAKSVILTTGNGSQHAIVILGGKNSLDLEDLAAGERTNLPSTRIFAVILACAWLVLLITVSGIKHDPWYLMAVGGIGMAQNVVVAGAPRRPEAFGIPLEFVECITHRKVMKALMAIEEGYPRVGSSLLTTYFPGELREDEMKFWDQKAKDAAKKDRPPEPGSSTGVTLSPPVPVVGHNDVPPGIV